MGKIFIYGKKSCLLNYYNAVKHFGFKPVISENLSLSAGCNGLILAGGGDVYPFFYGQNDYACIHKNLKRDICEFSLIDHFYKNNKPILGICRGIQILNVYFGGTLIQNIKNCSFHSACEKDVYHKVFSNDLFLFKNTCYKVNSAHHQAVLKIANCLNPVLFSSDNLVEGFLHKTAKILAVQFHPERMNYKTNSLSKTIFEYYFNLIQK